jgi:hypothetical protein
MEWDNQEMLLTTLLLLLHRPVLPQQPTFWHEKGRKNSFFGVGGGGSPFKVLPDVTTNGWKRGLNFSCVFDI